MGASYSYCVVEVVHVITDKRLNGCLFFYGNMSDIFSCDVYAECGNILMTNIINTSFCDTLVIDNNLLFVTYFL